MAVITIDIMICFNITLDCIGAMDGTCMKGCAFPCQEKPWYGHNCILLKLF